MFHVSRSAADPTDSLRSPGLPSSSAEMAKRGISMMAEQQRLRTVSGGLESLSVCDNSETERRFRRLEGQETRRKIKPHSRSDLSLYSLEITNDRNHFQKASLISVITL